MRRIPPSQSISSSPFLCIRCLQSRRQPTLLRRGSAFLTSTRSPPSTPTTDSSSKRNLSQLAGSVPDVFTTPNWNTLLHTQPPSGAITPSFPGISSDILDKMFESSPLWQSTEERKLISPSINTQDPEDIQKYLLRGSPIPKNTVDLLTVLDALIAKDDMARAVTVVASLKRQLDPGAPLSTLVYNKYLEGVICSSMQKNGGIGRAMEWYQEMNENGVKADRTTFALLSKAAFSLTSVSDANRAARKVFGLWRKQGGEVGDLLCDLMFPQEEIVRSLKLNKTTLEDISEGYRAVLEPLIELTTQSQTMFIDHKTSNKITLPEVRQTMSKSPNLAFMRKSLECLFTEDEKAKIGKMDPFVEPEPADIFESNLDMSRQRQLEEGAYQSALETWKYEMDEALKRGDIYTNRLGLRGLTWDWVQAMKPVLEEHIERIRPKYVNSDGEPVYASIEKDTDPNKMEHIWLTALPTEILCAITIMEVIRSQANEGRSAGSKAGNLISTIGKAVEREIQAKDMIRRENKGLHPRHINLRQLLTKRNVAERYAANFHKELICGIKSGVSYWPFEWRHDIRARCAAILVSSFLESAKVTMKHTDENGNTHTQVAPAWYHTYAYVLGKKVGMIKPNKFIAERLSTNAVVVRGLTTKLAPMLVPPKRWSSWDDGGYWYTREEVMRTRQSLEQKAYLKEASDSNHLTEVYRGLDILGETCWTINRTIFDIVLDVWNSGESVADIPPQASGLEYPPEPKTADWDVKARMDWIQECKIMSRTMQNAHSVRCDINYKLEIARAFIGKKLYFPHSLDFRGRAYPVPPHFNHLGNDLCRGLLLFHEGKPLGARGLRWLKIHLANVYGLDKMKLDEREEFAMNSLEHVFDAADHPLDGKRWWLNADDPWQCLATCIELTNAMRSEDPSAYVCHLPIHQDGSCNGLQHYAALGGDLEGARQVNLEPSDRPQDVYSGVAELVAADIERQALEGNDIAKACVGKITRKTVKQTVMTNVYGVTFVGAKAQIYRALKDKGDIETSLLNPASDLIARSTFKCLKDMFSGAHQIQEWLKECARRISKSLGPKDFQDKKPSNAFPFLSTVVWTTPLGLPVCQPYRKLDVKAISTLVSNLYLVNPNSIGAVNIRKQTTAFPPNFIHSLDASHMLKSAIACDQAGLTFASVHDSFWTHACDVDVMNVVLREAFVRMHKDDLIGRLRDEFMERYKGHYYFQEKVNVSSETVDASDLSEDPNGQLTTKRRPGSAWKPLEFPPIPAKGEFDVNRLRESTYFFS